VGVVWLARALNGALLLEAAPTHEADTHAQHVVGCRFPEQLAVG
jgi:hypothetical protein